MGIGTALFGTVLTVAQPAGRAVPSLAPRTVGVSWSYCGQASWASRVVCSQWWVAPMVGSGEPVTSAVSFQ
ncbi:hypothetical protein GCM10009664_41710 [Kitasatospora gansuensis]